MAKCEKTKYADGLNLVLVSSATKLRLRINSYRAINELERQQRMRRGEQVPARQALDVSVHTIREGMDYLGRSIEEQFSGA